MAPKVSYTINDNPLIQKMRKSFFSECSDNKPMPNHVFWDYEVEKQKLLDHLHVQPIKEEKEVE